MKTLILYASKYGTSEKCALMLQEKLPKAEVVNIDNAPVSITKYGTVIIGGGVYAGRIDARLRKFIKTHTRDIGLIPHGFFVCCADENPQKFLQENFPSALIENAIAADGFGSGLEIGYAKGFAKVVAGIFKLIYKTGGIPTRLFKERIEAFAEKFNNLK